jgi:hypothetical protein
LFGEHRVSEIPGQYRDCQKMPTLLSSEERVEEASDMVFPPLFSKERGVAGRVDFRPSITQT